MKDIEGTLRRIDEEITGHKQNIARSQVEVMRLQETRLVLMGIAEGDQAAQEQAKAERVHTINGSHAKPVLIVRREGSGEAETAKAEADRERWRQQAAKKRERKAAAVLAHDQPGPAPKPKAAKTKTPRASASGLWRPKVLATLQGETEGMTRLQLGDFYGLPRGEKKRKALSNALYSLTNQGKLARDHEGRFMLRRPG